MESDMWVLKEKNGAHVQSTPFANFNEALVAFGRVVERWGLIAHLDGKFSHYPAVGSDDAGVDMVLDARAVIKYVPRKRR